MGRSITDSKNFIWLILIFAAILRFYKLGDQSLWGDEILSVKIASLSVGEILSIFSKIQTHQSLYYLILHFLVPYKENEAVLRIPSLVFGVLSIGMMYLVFRDFLGKSCGILSAALMALSPFHLWYSQEARPYSLLLFLGLLSFYFFQKYIHENRKRHLAGFIIFVLAFFFTHMIALYFIFFLTLIAIWNWRQKNSLRFILPFIPIYLVVFPVLMIVLRAPETDSAGAEGVVLGQFLYAFWSFATGYSLGPSKRELHILAMRGVVFKYYPLILGVALTIGFLGVRGCWKLWKDSREKFYIMVLWLVLPLAFILLGASIFDHPIKVRYVILSFPAFLAFLAFGFMGAKRRWISYLGGCALSFIMAVANYNYFELPSYHKEDIRSASVFISREILEDDLIIVSASYIAGTLDYYLSGQRKRPPRLIGYRPVGRFVDEKIFPEDLKRILGDRSEMWILLCHNFQVDPKGKMKRYLETHFASVEKHSWSGVELIRYGKKSKLEGDFLGH